MFRGVSSINVDIKGRISLPTRYRDNIEATSEGKLIFTIDTEDKCLLLYPLPHWEKIEAKLAALPSFNRAARRIQRLLLGHATDALVDAQGRVLIPPTLREFANLDKKIMLVGQGKKFEIWDEETWFNARDAWLAMDNLNMEQLPETLTSLSL